MTNPFSQPKPIDPAALQIALAGFLHDIGKFTQRAEGGPAASGEMAKGFFPVGDFLDRQATLLLPKRPDGRHTHLHAAFTAAFLDHFEKWLPQEFQKVGWGLDESLVTLAAAHHRPATPLQWIIAEADRLSSGFDRSRFEGEYNRNEEFPGWKQARLRPLLEELEPDGDDVRADAELATRIPLRVEATGLPFPLPKSEAEGEEKAAVEEYRALFQDFALALETILHRDVPALWFEHFDSLCERFLGVIPAATVRPMLPDTSLYDHSRGVASLATALFLYHRANGSLRSEAVQDRAPQKFLLIQAEFYGIQNFIFAEGGVTQKRAAKLLRGRSFYVTLLADLAADLVRRQLGLPHTSVLFQAAGKTLILAPNLPEVPQALATVENALNRWLIDRFYGEVSVGIASLAAAPADLESQPVQSGKKPQTIAGARLLWGRLALETARRKAQRFDLAEFGGVRREFLDQVQKTGICGFCGHRPEMENVRLGDRGACGVCHDQAILGERLVQFGTLAVSEAAGPVGEPDLVVPIYDAYQLTFYQAAKLRQEAVAGRLLHCWDIGLKERGAREGRVTRRPLAGYVPRQAWEDGRDDLLLGGRQSEERRLELIDRAKTEGTVKDFTVLAKHALADDGLGLEALGVLKADVDNLGAHFALGLPMARQTFTRTSVLSRQLNGFFAAFIPAALQGREDWAAWYPERDWRRFQYLYTVFAGGDDLLLAGPWNRVIEFAGFLAERFTAYAGGNPRVTLSAGISIHKPGEPIRHMAARAEEALDKAKKGVGGDRLGGGEAGRKACLTLFDETVTWETFRTLQGVREDLAGMVGRGEVNTALLHRLNALLEDIRSVKAIEAGRDVVSQADLGCLSWKARLQYSVIRNVGRDRDGGDRREVADRVGATLLAWLSVHGTAFRIPLWQVLYSNRRVD